MKSKSVLSAILSTFLLGACQQTMNHGASSFNVNADIAGNTDASRTSMRDAFGATEILSTNGAQGWFSVAHITTNDRGVISRNGEAPRLILKGWNELKGKSLIFGKTGVADTTNGSITYERFTFDGNNCFHFHKLKAPSMTDARARYRQLLTGYVCVRGPKLSTDEAAMSFLNAIEIPPIHIRRNVKDASPVTLFQPVRPIRANLMAEPTNF